MKTLSEKARELRNEYQREYRRKHPEKLKQYNVEYWEKKAKNYSIDQEVKKFSEKGFSQREISRELNISLGRVNKILNAE